MAMPATNAKAPNAKTILFLTNSDTARVIGGQKDDSCGLEALDQLHHCFDMRHELPLGRALKPLDCG